MEATNMTGVRGAITLAVLVCCSLVGGCGGGMGKFNVTLVPAESLKENNSIPSFEADLVGVSEVEMPAWKSMSLGSYFSGASKVRADADKYTMRFTNADAGQKTLKRDDPIWKQWAGKGASSLFVLVNLPGMREPLSLPLDTSRWSDDTIVLEVQRTGVVPRTPMKPAK